jgi:hypothetical protein
MALNSATLKSELIKIMDSSSPSFTGFPATIADAVDSWTNAYDLYASVAQSVSGDVVLTKNATGFKSALLRGLTTSVTEYAAASAFEQAFVAYWTGATFNITLLPSPTSGNIGGNGIFGVVLSSIVSSITANVLKSNLLNAFLVKYPDVDSAVTAISSAFHTATTTAISVLISGLDTTPPLGGPLPITNTNLIF